MAATPSLTATGRTDVDEEGGLARVLALAGGAVLSGVFVATLAGITRVVGGTPTLLAVVAGALVLAAVLARALRPRTAALLAAGMVAAGAVVYLNTVPLGWTLLGDLGGVVLDAAALLTGISLLRMTEAGTWAIGAAPAPVFLTWYLLFRRQYAAGVAVAGGALLVVALTGDVGVPATLIGVLGGAAVLGFGELEARGGTPAEMDTLAVVLSAMVVVTASVSVVPAGAASPFVPSPNPATVESGVVDAGDRVSVLGSVELSPEVRFVVESDRPAYWKVGAYDRYTGQGWVRSGEPRSLEDGLGGTTPGISETVVQTVTVRDRTAVMPAAWRPSRLAGDGADRASVTSMGSLQPAGALGPGDSYTVWSQVTVTSEDWLAGAGTTYPDDVARRYTQLPPNTPDRVGEFAARLTEDLSSPYAKATRIERWLETTKGYSLDVRRPTGDVADGFIFEMDEGYCVYFATAMVVMLRSQDIPARMAVGYTSGQRVAEDTWVVRGMDSHAWVEVYFPGVGWVEFDPTPGGPRQGAETDRLEEARENGVPDVDARGSENGSWTPTPGPGETGGEDGGADGGGETSGPAGGVITEAGELPTAIESPGAGGGDDRGRRFPREAVGLGLIVAVGVAAGLRRIEAVARTRRIARVYWQGGRGDPAADLERAVERVEYVMARRYRPRRPGESRWAYLRTVGRLERDDRFERLGRLYLRATYGPGVDAAEVDVAVRLTDTLVREASPVLDRLRR